VVVIDSEFTSLLTILTSLGIEDMGSNGYLILLLCQDVIHVCSSNVMAKLQKANAVVVGLQQLK
jgi:hypothetical protein